jgi:signal transduction histidine kinase
MGGVAVIDPKAIQINTEPPPVIIEEFHLGNEAIDFLSGVEIGPDINNFEIRYTAPSFIKPEQVKFKYKLVGLDEDWIDAGDRRTANYYRIPAGRYRFVVIAANSDGVWNTEGKSIEIVIVPPFWRRWWFIASAIVASLSIVLLIYERRVWRLRREHTLQQAFSQQLIGSQESERRRISNEMHDSLGQDLNIIKVRALLSKERLTDNDAVKEELDEITFLAEKIYGEMKEIAYDLRPYQLDKIGLSKTIERMVRRVGRACEIDFVTDIAEIDDFFEKDSQINIYRIVQESVNNIIKHSKATRARVTIKRGAGSVEISIEDNGEGFRLEPIDPTDPAKKSFGLMGISERAKMLGGEVEVRSDHGQGTTVVVRFKLKEARYER